MGSSVPTHPIGQRWLGILHVLILLGLPLCLCGCDPGGGQSSLFDARRGSHSSPA